MIVVITVIFLLLSSPFIWWYIFLLQKRKSFKRIPGPKPLPIVGNALSLGQTPYDFFNHLLENHAKFGDIFKIYMGHEVRIVISNPELLKDILTSNVHITKSNGYDLIKPWVAEGVLTSTGTKWKSRRKMMTSAFHFKTLEHFVEVFNSCGDILIEKLSHEIGNKCLDVYPYMSLCAFDIVCKTLMGIKASAQNGKDTEFVEAVRGFLDISAERFYSGWKRIDWLFTLFSQQAKSIKSYLKILHTVADNIIQNRREETLEDPVSDNGVKKKIDLLDLLLHLEDKRLSNDDIKEEINTILFGGHDTSSSSISFMLLALAENPDVQEKVYKEIVSFFGQKKNIYVSRNEVQNMKYLDLVFKETQRLYSVVPLVERRLDKNWSIGGYDFPKNTFLTLSIYALHHNEKYYPDPYKFDPDRFLPENQSRRHIYSYIPFSAGPRNCVGQKFAVLSVKTILIKILKNFRLIAVPDFKAQLGVAAILKSYNGVCIQLQRRAV